LAGSSFLVSRETSKRDVPRTRGLQDDERAALRRPRAKHRGAARGMRRRTDPNGSRSECDFGRDGLADGAQEAWRFVGDATSSKRRGRVPVGEQERRRVKVRPITRYIYGICRYWKFVRAFCGRFTCDGTSPHARSLSLHKSARHHKLLRALAQRRSGGGGGGGGGRGGRS